MPFKRIVKKYITVAISFILIFLLFRVSFKYLAKWFHEKDYEFKTESPFAKIYTHEDLALDFYELNSLKSLIRLSVHAVDSLLENENEKIHVFIGQGYDSAVAVPEFNKISMYNSKYCYAAFCHEYIHVVLGVFDELWFSEGVATYLSQHIRNNNPQLKKYCDGDDSYLKERWELFPGKLRTTSYFLEKYNYASIKKLLFETRHHVLLTEENIHDYYYLSTSFCQFLFERIGFETMIALVLEISNSHKSITKTLDEKDIDLDVLIDDWLADFKAK